MAFLTHVAAGLSMPMTFAVPPSGNFLRDRVHSDSWTYPSWQVLSPVASETQNVQERVTSVFHLHNNRSRCELNVHMNGQHLKHYSYPAILASLDRTLSYREDLSRSAAKLKCRNNLIVILAGTSWSAGTSTLVTGWVWGGFGNIIISTFV